MYKVLFSYKQDNPAGGNTSYSGWTEEIKLYDADTAKELQAQIDEFIKDNKNGYRKNITVMSIDKL